MMSFHVGSTQAFHSAAGVSFLVIRLPAGEECPNMTNRNTQPPRVHRHSVVSRATDGGTELTTVTRFIWKSSARNGFEC